jgi:hypothetical protein
MVFNDRLYEDSDYALVDAWWKGWEKSGPKQSWLPKIGCVVMLNAKPVAMTWLWWDPTSALAQMAFSITDPGAAMKARMGALVRSFAFLENEARKLGVDTVHGICGDTTLAKIAMHRKFTVGEQHFTCFKDLGESCL